MARSPPPAGQRASHAGARSAVAPPGQATCSGQGEGLCPAHPALEAPWLPSILKASKGCSGASCSPAQVCTAGLPCLSLRELAVALGHPPPVLATLRTQDVPVHTCV